VYAYRLVIARKYAGLELGTELINWAGLHGARRYGAQWVRVDVWRSNAALHDYYQARGFEPCGECADPRYPSGALFQKLVATITEPSFPRFPESFCTLVAPFAATRHAPGRRHGRAVRGRPLAHHGASPDLGKFGLPAPFPMVLQTE
jgi:hypothetical protein